MIWRSARQMEESGNLVEEEEGQVVRAVGYVLRVHLTIGGERGRVRMMAMMMSVGVYVCPAGMIRSAFRLSFGPNPRPFFVLTHC